jgi:Cu(I)/Ag(I) efflux system membrane protein CusA/SilA
MRGRRAAPAASEADLLDAIREGAVLRVRPKAMTVAVIIAGLVPIMIGAVGTGSEVHAAHSPRRWCGGMITGAFLLTAGRCS